MKCLKCSTHLSAALIISKEVSNGRLGIYKNGAHIVSLNTRSYDCSEAADSASSPILTHGQGQPQHSHKYFSRTWLFVYRNFWVFVVFV
jgi:hypothetical protein